MDFAGSGSVLCFLFWNMIWMLGSSPISYVNSQRPTLGLRILAPDLRRMRGSVTKAIQMVRTNSLRRRQIRSLRLDIRKSDVVDNPSEIFEMFCSDILPNRINTVLFLPLRDESKFIRLTNYLSNIIHDLGMPLMSYNPYLTGSLQNQKKSRTVQLSPTIYHEAQVMLQLLYRYNWTHITIVTSSGVNSFDFINAITSLVKENNDFQGYPRKPRLTVVTTMIYTGSYDIYHVDEETKEFLTKNNHKDSRIYLLHTSRGHTRSVMDAAEDLGIAGPDYMWLLTSSSIGAVSRTTNLPIGIFAITFRGEHGSDVELDQVANVTKTAIEAWIDAMQKMSSKGYSMDDQHPGVSCNNTQTSNSWAVGEELYNQILGGSVAGADSDYPVEFNDIGLNKYVHLHILNVQEVVYSGRIRGQLVEVGSWTPVVTRVRYSKKIEMKLEMQGITWPGKMPSPPKGRPDRRFFRIATLEELPYVMYKDLDNSTGECGPPSIPCRLVYNETIHGKNDSSLFNGTVVRCCAGLSIDLLNILSEKMAFDFDLFEVADRSFGVENEITGEWNGLIRALQDRQADMVLTALQITPKRNQLIEFSMPYLETGTTIVVSLRKGAISPTAVLEPYDYPSWCLILVFSVHSIGASIFIFEWLSPWGLDQGNTPMREHAFSLFRSFWLIWAMLFGASVSADNPRGGASRFLANVWALFALVFLASYTANLAAFMITKEVYYDLSGIKDWRLTNPHSHKPPFKFATVPNGSTEENLRQNHPEMFRYMKKYNQPSVREAVKALKKGEIQAFIYDATPLEYQIGIDADCHLISVGKWYAMTGYGVGFPKGSGVLVDEVNSYLLDLQEFGELDRLRKFWLAGACHSKQKRKQNSHQLGILNFTSAFILLASGIVLGGILLILEHLYFRFGRKCLKQYDKCGCCALVSLSMGKSLTFEQSVMEALDYTKKHRCKDPICETQIWKVKHQLDIALLKIDKLNKDMKAKNGKTPSPLAITASGEHTDPLKVKDDESSDPIGRKRREAEEDALREKEKEFALEESYPSRADDKDGDDDVPYENQEENNVSPDQESDSIRSPDRSMRRSPSYNQAVATDAEGETVVRDPNQGLKQRKLSDGKYYSSVNNEEV
ncbi:glutamate receptor ionotropic, NMDA 2A-like [Pecten maximus]|uniref:glutamate receptor ionotropic, NMDA 2A-like n=1 Tax=Pecten maximus TaxID=6579 RepID=UPI001458D5E1|nr:glutamate receptor ionotropic, NMDA 2A-like [Pecten maximus]